MVPLVDRLAVRTYSNYYTKRNLTFDVWSLHFVNMYGGMITMLDLLVLFIPTQRAQLRYTPALPFIAFTVEPPVIATILSLYLWFFLYNPSINPLVWYNQPDSRSASFNGVGTYSCLCKQLVSYATDMLCLVEDWGVVLTATFCQVLSLGPFGWSLNFAT